SVYPAVFSFSYSKALGAGRDEVGQEPYMVDMGNIGFSLSGGQATLLDINGDALPDILDTSQPGRHRFFLNTPDMEGNSHFNTNPVNSALAQATGANIQLGPNSPTVQVLDANGDGFTDLLNAATGTILLNRGTGDWHMGSISNIDSMREALGDGELGALRFMDYNNDKRIDLIRANQQATSFLQNNGEQGFRMMTDVAQLEASFENDGVQLSDMNGDGLIDVVVVTLGQLRYRLNYGWGDWGPWVT
ncbi:MAG: VCBS repeat-containing protein, partial [Myxococcota bacterium]